MLNQIHIRDLATIEDQHIHLNDGCTMITGETGAGKSIFIEAIELALGDRASAGMIRHGKERADISLCFDTSHLPKVAAWLNANDLPVDADECIIRRTIAKDGRSRSYINGLPTTLQLLRELSELLFHLHGQYEQQVLLKTDNQRDMLDRYAEQLPLANQVRQLAQEWHALNDTIESLRHNAKHQQDRIEHLTFQHNELSALNLATGEWESLEAEHRKLTHSDELLRNLQRVLSLLADDETHNTQSKLKESRKLLEHAKTVETKADHWLNSLNTVIIQLDDIENDVRTYLEDVNLDPEHLQTIEQRVSQIFDLARKHKVQPQDLLALQSSIAEELASLDSSDERLQVLNAELNAIAKQYTEQATKLSHHRAKAAKAFAEEITKTIRSLSLPHAEFTVRFEKEPSPFASHGLERMVFVIKTNPDQAQQPLAKVVSGGELSRLSLAVHLAIAKQTTAATLIFDEVDTGVGGATAEKIGKLLKKLGESNQVFCVTHQPQVAANGHQHLLVEKCIADKKTHTRFRLLNQGERTHEIARMLGGETITEKTIAHAKEVLANA